MLDSADGFEIIVREKRSYYRVIYPYVAGYAEYRQFPIKPNPSRDGDGKLRVFEEQDDRAAEGLDSFDMPGLFS